MTEEKTILIYHPATCCVCNQQKPCAKWLLMIHETFLNNHRVCLACWCKISDFIDTIRAKP